MTLKDLYETIKQKKENALNDRERYIEKQTNLRDDDFASQSNYYEYKIVKLKGEVDAYTDILCLIESSGVLDEK